VKDYVRSAELRKRGDLAGLPVVRLKPFTSKASYNKGHEIEEDDRRVELFTPDTGRNSHRCGASRRSRREPEDVIAGLGMNRRTIYRWLANFHYGGEESLKAKPIVGAPVKMNVRQMAKIIREKNPLRLKFECALWTLAMIRQLILKQFDVRLSETSVGRLTKAWASPRSGRCTRRGNNTPS